MQKELLFKIEEFINRLREESKEKVIIVEGLRDKRALKRLRISKVECLSGKPSFKIAEQLRGKQVILLLDRDSEGKRIAKELLQSFQMLGIKVDLKFWKELGKLKIGRVESLALNPSRGDPYGEDFTYISKVHNSCFPPSRRDSRKTRRDRGDIWTDGGLTRT
jgi:5S rRNA maturation endonuclease (ribonuclease M5)